MEALKANATRQKLKQRQFITAEAHFAVKVMQKRLYSNACVYIFGNTWFGKRYVIIRAVSHVQHSSRNRITN